MKRLLVLFIVVGLSLVGVSYWLTRTTHASSVQYKLEVVDVGPVVGKVNASGRLVPKEVVAVMAESPGARVVSIAPQAEVGQRVKAGELLVRLDDRAARLKWDQAQEQKQAAQMLIAQAKLQIDKAYAGLHLAQSRLQFATKALEVASKVGQVSREAREKEELAEKAVAEARAGLELAQVQVQEAQLAYEAAQAKVREADLAVRAAELALETCSIRAPVSGIILERKVQSGQLVSYQSPAALFLIAPDNTPLEVQAQVGESDVVRLQEGLPAEVTVDAYADMDLKFRGKVVKISEMPVTTLTRLPMGLDAGALSMSGPLVYGVTVQLTSNSGKANEFRLRPGMTVSLAIVLQEVSQAMRVPNVAFGFEPDQMSEEERAALAKFSSKNNKALWVWQGADRLQLVIVETGLSDGQKTQVVRVLYPHDQALRPGMEIVTEIISEHRKGLFESKLPIRF
ncbi:MAG: hypothetical protein C4297_05165 [Gemmataceae bacterium]